ncbi:MULTISPECIES: hypothetical protein [Vibrio harveyi group]|uniref:hypothetical protein n=1 Tax=Vibrio harveyi group TaxID=717610 RepID=UPI00040481A3|nr:MULTISPECIES: hypothetical protein [Vibrio harveyi group]KZC47897.1 hypothetical protein XM68_c10760 [Vibrio alginolyticus]MCR9984744.1 hypothetical protein [Vibrio alginolyticus]
MKIIGLTKKSKDYPDAYHRLTALQKALYRLCEKEFENAKQRIQAATEVLKVRERTINKSKVARLAAKELNKKKLNHSHMSKSNCPFLFNSIKSWNARLEAEYKISPACMNAASKQPTKDELKAEIKALKKPLKSIGHDVYDYYVKSCLLAAESELKSMVDKLEKDNSVLREKLVNTQLQNETFIKQLADDEGQKLKIKRLEKEVIELKAILSKNSIDY